MNLVKLFELQEDLDEHIRKKHKLENKSLLSEKVLALQVELAELANETKCFKFWSEKKSSEKHIVLEEFADCLHFILALGLEKDFKNVSLNAKDSDYDITAQFLNLYVDINDFVVCCSQDHYATLFEDFFSLGISLGFSYKEIESAYLKKNSINHKRQNENY